MAKKKKHVFLFSVGGAKTHFSPVARTLLAFFSGVGIGRRRREFCVVVFSIENIFAWYRLI